MKKQSLKIKLQCVAMIALTLALSYSLSFASAGSAPAVQSPASHVPELVTLTVLSTCSSAQVRLAGSENLNTPFSKSFPRGQVILLEALDSAVPLCNAFYAKTEPLT